MSFDADAGLRPTPDRVRETLFNWLAPTLPGCRCLDLFAGSGALGIEALSRGAAELVLVENRRAQASRLQQHLTALDARAQTQVVRADALRWLASADTPPFDLVLLDPPFAAGLLTPACKALEAHRRLQNNALIYLESARSEQLELPSNWTLIRDKTAGRVAYRLARREELLLQ